MGLTAPKAGDTPPPVSYHTINVDGLDIFYREAGPADGPVLLLLHGFPSSSRMYQSLLFSDLNHQYHLIAPAYPGFGHFEDFRSCVPPGAELANESVEGGRKHEAETRDPEHPEQHGGPE